MKTLIYATPAVKGLKMAGIVHNLDIDAQIQYRRAFRRNRLIRDRKNPLDFCDDVKLRERFRFRRCDIFELVDDLNPDLEYTTDMNIYGTD